MNDDSILPTEEMEKLRREIELLKKKQGISEPRYDYSGMMDSMNSVSRSINSLMRIFKEASDEMKLDTHDALLVSQKIDKILDRLDKIETQNEKIAKGIVAIADMVEDIGAAQNQKAQPPMRMSQQPPSYMPQPAPRQAFEPRPLPTYNLSPDDQKKKNSFLNFKI